MVKISWDDTKIAKDDFASTEWNAMVTDQKTRGVLNTLEEFAGSVCTGVDAATGRVLTLGNTSLTKHNDVFVEGLLISPSKVTISHKAASSTVTFTSIKIYDTDEIVVREWT